MMVDAEKKTTTKKVKLFQRMLKEELEKIPKTQNC